MKKYIRSFMITLLVLLTLTGAVSVWGYYDEAAAGYPSWWIDGFGPSDVYHNDPSEPRVVDGADIFSAQEEAELSRKLAEMKEKHQVDLVIVTDNNDYGLGLDRYATSFYDMKGYGYGSDYSGVVMFISMEPGDRGWWCGGTGKAEKYFTEENVNHMDDDMEPYMVNGRYGDGVKKYFSDLDTLLTKGRFPLSAKRAIAFSVVSMIIGAIVGFIFLGKASASMRAVAPAVQASQYLIPDSFKVNGANDVFLNTSVTKTLIESSSSSRSGGGSSFGSHTSSGGHSFSGGGRRF